MKDDDEYLPLCDHHSCSLPHPSVAPSHVTVPQNYISFLSQPFEATFFFVTNIDWVLTMVKHFHEDLPEGVGELVGDDTLQISKWEAMDNWHDSRDPMSLDDFSSIPRCSMQVSVNGNSPMP